MIDGETGYLVAPDDSAELAAAIRRILDDPDLAAKMGEAGRKRAVSEFNQKLTAQRNVALYMELLEN